MKPMDSRQLQEAAKRLQKGDVVGLPTETVYGLAAGIESEAGLKKIFALKQRPFFDPLIVHVDSFQMAQTLVAEWPPLADFLARRFWPGPLTLVLPKAAHVSDLITSGLSTVAVRYPQHPLFLEVIRLTGQPLAAPSANQFGRTSPTTAAHVCQEFPNEKGLLVLDGGACDVGVESTVIAFASTSTNQEALQILRPGGVTEQSLKEALRMWSRPVAITHQQSQNSPGHLKHHYMPTIPLVLVNGESLSTAEILKRLQAVGVTAQSSREIQELVLDKQPHVAARKLYAQMREPSADSSTKALFVRFQPFMHDHLWVAIWDRLTRAASYDWRLPSLVVGAP